MPGHALQVQAQVAGQTSPAGHRLQHDYYVAIAQGRILGTDLLVHQVYRLPGSVKEARKPLPKHSH